MIGRVVERKSLIRAVESDESKSTSGLDLAFARSRPRQFCRSAIRGVIYDDLV